MTFFRAMGRNRRQLKLSRAQLSELRRLLLCATDDRDRERLQVALWSAGGQHTMEELAERIGKARSTIQNWLRSFDNGGIAGLLKRETPAGSVSPIASPRIQASLKAGMQAGRWRSAAQVAAWLKSEHGIERARKSIYYWFQKYRLSPLLTKGRTTSRRSSKQ